MNWLCKIHGEAQHFTLLFHKLRGQCWEAWSLLLPQWQEAALGRRGLVSSAQHSSAHASLLACASGPSAVPDNSKAFAFSLFLHLMLFRNNFNCTTPDFFQCWGNGVDLETVKRDFVCYLRKLYLYIGILCIEDWDAFHKETIQSGLTKV